MSKDEAFKEQYEVFMRQYQDHGHMEQLKEAEIHLQSQFSVYLPHHAVWQKSDNRRKLRVVFDASRRSHGGESLNRLLFPGPPL